MTSEATRLVQRHCAAQTFGHCITMSSWWTEASEKPIHFRELTPLPGDGDNVRLPIQKARGTLTALIRDNPLSGARSPPGSGKTMFLPELLLEWVHGVWNTGAMVIVLPTQYAAQKIKESFVEFRGWDQRRICLIIRG